MKKQEVFKVTYLDNHVILFNEVDISTTINEILESDFNKGETIEISKIEMTKEEIDELQEFDGF